MKRSATGEDYTLSENGLSYCEAMLDKGVLKDGTPVCAAIVVLAETDWKNPHHQLKLVNSWSAFVMRERLNGLPPYPGKHGAYWWVTADKLMDGDEAF